MLQVDELFIQFLHRTSSIALHAVEKDCGRGGSDEALTQQRQPPRFPTYSPPASQTFERSISNAFSIFPTTSGDGTPWLFPIRCQLYK